MLLWLFWWCICCIMVQPRYRFSNNNKKNKNNTATTIIHGIVMIIVVILMTAGGYDNGCTIYRNYHHRDNFVGMAVVSAFVVVGVSTTTISARKQQQLLLQPLQTTRSRRRRRKIIQYPSTTTVALSLFRKRQLEENIDTEQLLVRQVISDVDDTLKSSGGIKIMNTIALGGIDIQYPRNTIYPGVAEFMWQLSLAGSAVVGTGADGDGTNTSLHSRRDDKDYDDNAATSTTITTIIPKVAILTARAYELLAFLEMKATNPLSIRFRNTAMRYFHNHHDNSSNNNSSNNNNSNSSRSNEMIHWGFAPVLYGSIVEWIFQDRKGLRKFHNFEQLLRLQQQQQIKTTTTNTPPIPIRWNYIYVGDTGEYDEEAGMAMLQYYPQYIQGIFLHVVSDDVHAVQTNTVAKSTTTKYIHGRPVLYFRTYIGAALLAVQHGWIPLSGLQWIVTTVESQMLVDVVPQSQPQQVQYVLNDNQRHDLQQDLDRAHQFLCNHSEL